MFSTMQVYKGQKVADNDEKIQAVIKALLNHKDLLIRAATGVYGVDRARLGGRFKGVKSIAESHEERQHLSIPEEALVNRLLL